MPLIALAQSAAIDVIPATSTEEGGMNMDNIVETHPPLKLSPDKSEIVTLPDDAGTIVLGNPAHLNILADSSKRLIVVPKMPGASYFTVLDKLGNVIMQRHVLVAPPKEKYVRVRKTCYGDSLEAGCQATQTYYCPDICHEVASGYSSDESKGGASADTAGMSKAANKMSGDAGKEGADEAENEDTQE
ncbi:MAG: pilus assembly protein N-terminal domain-containing protein [Alphaproteobacteria bacterium]|nr:pilus assembly protein N-terminal domain-containing protein [Alphaproteobacteria bacterium]MCD8525836.1 pilus assembly protein N-terminal domain-containing protein [Alphaproteobacteria bacterium]